MVAGVIAGPKALMHMIRKFTLPYFGGKLAPFEAWLLIRGLRTLSIRVKEQGAIALEIALKLVEHPAIEKVHHPGLDRLPKGLLGK